MVSSDRNSSYEGSYLFSSVTMLNSSWMSNYWQKGTINYFSFGIQSGVCQLKEFTYFNPNSMLQIYIATDKSIKHTMIFRATEVQRAIFCLLTSYFC